MTEVHNDSDISGVPNQTISTDSEESFLMKQLNKSQLFNNSSSSGSAGQRRSHFRESFIDDDGNMKSFSVYQDVINETSDESREISLTGLSTFDFDNIVGQEPRNSALANILSEVDENNRIRQGHRKSASVSRSDSLREVRKTHKRMSGSSFRISSYAQIPPSGSSSGSDHPHHSSSTGSYRTAGSVSDKPQADPRIASSYYGSVRGYGFPSSLFDPEERPLSLDQLGRVPTPDYHAPPPPSQIPLADGAVSRGALYDENEATLDALTGLGQIARKQKPTSSTGSFKSAHSMTRESIMNFEETRKKQKGTPHLIMANTQSAHTTVKFHDETANIYTAENVSDPGVTPSIHSPSSDVFAEAADDASIRNSRRAKVYSGKPVIKKTTGLKEFKLRPASRDFSTSVTPYFKQDPNDSGDYTHDPLLEKIHYDRSNRPERVMAHTHYLAWLLFCVAFIIPPLFFFLGFGLLDAHIGTVDVGTKRISILTGTLVVMTSLAMIGVGFGVGITQAQ